MSEQQRGNAETPWAVTCPSHGKVFLDKSEYLKQLNNSNSEWKCPKCNSVSDWDDDHYETYWDRQGPQD